MNFSQDELLRYKRNVLLPGVGEEGQAKLAQAKVLVVGSGGLGSPVDYYLAAAGVGTIGIVDADCVDQSNLQRQILHSTDDLGRPKVLSAAEKLRRLNPHINVIPHQVLVTTDNVMEIIKAYDLVVDATDNFPVRFALNDACVAAQKPFFHGGVLAFYGQALTYIPGRGPCYRCIFRQPPPVGVAPTSAEIGILGAVAGTIGVIEATEVIKYILGIGQLLVGRMLTYDALEMKFSEVSVSPDPHCAACGS